MTKSELRRVYLDERGSLSQEDRKDASKRIADNFFDDFDLNEIRFLHCFVSIERLNEIDTRPIFERLWDEFPQVMTVVPRIDHETGDLESLIYSPETAVAEGAWRINEPIHDEAVP